VRNKVSKGGKTRKKNQIPREEFGKKSVRFGLGGEVDVLKPKVHIVVELSQAALKQEVQSFADGKIACNRLFQAWKEKQGEDKKHKDKRAEKGPRPRRALRFFRRLSKLSSYWM
jgi:hypothetical protein